MGSLLKDTPHPAGHPPHMPSSVPKPPAASHPPSAPTNLQTLDVSREWNYTLCGLAFPRASVSQHVSTHHSPPLLSKTPRRGQTTLYLHLRRLAGARARLWALRAVRDDAPGNTRGQALARWHSSPRFNSLLRCQATGQSCRASWPRPQPQTRLPSPPQAC